MLHMDLWLSVFDSDLLLAFGVRLLGVAFVPGLQCCYFWVLSFVRPILGFVFGVCLVVHS